MKWAAQTRDAWIRQPHIQGVIVVTNTDEFSPMTDGFDALRLVILDDDAPASANHHFFVQPKQSVQERWLGRGQLDRWILAGTDRRIVPWLLNGDIVYDRDDDLRALREQLSVFPERFGEKRRFLEFNAFIHQYLRSREYLRQGQVMDAYSNILIALHHWARLAILEAGRLPELTMWSQVKTINPGVYKLYDELIHGQEPIAQRIELMLLASEFSVMSKMKDACRFLLDIIASRPEGWSIGQLAEHPDIDPLDVDLSLVLNKLVSRSLVRATYAERSAMNGTGRLERIYLAG